MTLKVIQGSLTGSASSVSKGGEWWGEIMALFSSSDDFCPKIWVWGFPGPWGFDPCPAELWEQETAPGRWKVGPLTYRDWRAEHGAKKDYSWALRSLDVYLTRFWTCLRPTTPTSLFFPFGMGISILCLSHCCIWRNTIVWVHSFTAVEEFCLRTICPLSPTHICLDTILMRFQTLQFRVDTGKN